LYFSIDVQVGGHPTIASNPNIGLSLPQNWVREEGGKRSWEGKQNFYTHNFVSYPPTHHMLEVKRHKI
jgi:hypothetical protein